MDARLATCDCHRVVGRPCPKGSSTARERLNLSQGTSSSLRIPTLGHMPSEILMYPDSLRRTIEESLGACPNCDIPNSRLRCNDRRIVWPRATENLAPPRTGYVLEGSGPVSFASGRCWSCLSSRQATARPESHRNDKWSGQVRLREVCLLKFPNRSGRFMPRHRSVRLPGPCEEPRGSTAPSSRC